MLDLYRNIKKRRIEQEMSQEDLAKACGYTNRSSIAKIEAGEVDLPLSKIQIFADALNTTPSDLMGETWESNVLANARLDVTDYFEGDAFKIARFQEAEFNDATRDTPPCPAPDAPSEHIEEAYYSFAKQAQDEGIAPEDIEFAIAMLKKLREKEK
jgi:transcriptional regulator with XRE-family HTH domain